MLDILSQKQTFIWANGFKLGLDCSNFSRWIFICY